MRGSIQTHRPTILPFVGPRFRHLKAPSSTLSELLVGGQETIETSRERKEGPRGHRHVRAGHWMRDVGQHPGYMGIVAREGRERWLTNLRTCHVFVVALDQEYSTGHALRAEHHGCEGSTASEQQQKSQMGGGPGSARKRMNTKKHGHGRPFRNLPALRAWLPPTPHGIDRRIACCLQPTKLHSHHKSHASTLWQLQSA